MFSEGVAAQLLPGWDELKYGLVFKNRFKWRRIGGVILHTSENDDDDDHHHHYHHRVAICCFNRGIRNIQTNNHRERRRKKTIVCHVQTQLWFIQLINYQQKKKKRESCCVTQHDERKLKHNYWAEYFECMHVKEITKAKNMSHISSNLINISTHTHIYNYTSNWGDKCSLTFRMLSLDILNI